MNAGHHVFAVHNNGCVFRSTQRNVQDRPILGDIDLVSAEHRLDARLQAAFLGQLKQKIERLIGDSIFGIVEVDTGCLGRHPLATRWIIVEKLPQMQL